MSAQCRIRSQLVSQRQLSVTDSQLLSSVSTQCRIRNQLVSVSSVSDSQLLSSVSAQCRIRSQFIVSVSSVSDSQLLSSVTRIQSQSAVSAQSVKLADSPLRLPLNPSTLAASAARMLSCSLKCRATRSLLAMAVSRSKCWLNETDGSTQILSDQCRN